MRYKKLVLFFLGTILSVIAFPQEKKPALLVGTVKDAYSKLPLIEAVITLSADSFEGQKFALTDSTGNYRINNLLPGVYSIWFEMEGYEKFVQDSLTIKEGGSLGVSFQMVKERKGKDKDKEVRQVKDTGFRKVIIEPVSL